MLKIIISGRRSKNLTRPEFYSHLLNQHASLVRSSDALAAPLLRYVQNHVRTIDDGCDLTKLLPLQEPRDSVIELWWKDFEALQGALTHPQYLSEIRTDEEYFTDQSNLIVLPVEELELTSSPTDTSPLKSFDFLKVRQGIEPEVVAEIIHEGSKSPSTCSGAVKKSILNKVLATPATFAESAQFDFVFENWISDKARFLQHHTRVLGKFSEYLDINKSFSLYACEHCILDRVQWKKLNS